ESISRTRKQMQFADILLVVLDARTIDLRDPEQSINIHLSSLGIEQNDKTAIVVTINKIDLIPLDKGIHHASFLTVPISALKEIGLGDLAAAIWSSLGLCALDVQVPIAWTSRQRELLNELTYAPNTSKVLHLLEKLRDG
ncbi:MAG TPA: hypothetical protein VKJ65_09865, partial [Phycisphaerae bacterium]|nr:hypothetical protein [Phycisphaerae bacterium]